MNHKLSILSVEVPAVTLSSQPRTRLDVYYAKVDADLRVNLIGVPLSADGMQAFLEKLQALDVQIIDPRGGYDTFDMMVSVSNDSGQKIEFHTADLQAKVMLDDIMKNVDKLYKNRREPSLSIARSVAG